VERLDRDGAKALLCKKYEELLNLGENRYPRRSDFSDVQVEAIKAFLGPWPRALEAAGIKPPRDDGGLEKKTEKRILAKRRKTEFKKAKGEKK
jgi:hypothetical protein